LLGTALPPGASSDTRRVWLWWWWWGGGCCETVLVVARERAVGLVEPGNHCLPPFLLNAHPHPCVPGGAPEVVFVCLCVCVCVCVCVCCVCVVRACVLQGAEAIGGVSLDSRGRMGGGEGAWGKWGLDRGVFAAGDCRRGQSLVVTAIAEGLAAAKACDAYLKGPQA
jgi:hypothetical protein